MNTINNNNAGYNYFANLPKEIFSHIFSFLNPNDPSSWQLLRTSQLFKETGDASLDPSLDKNKWLKWAVQNENLPVIQRLLNHPKVQEEEAKQDLCETALMQAIWDKKINSFKELINRGDWSDAEYSAIINEVILQLWSEKKDRSNKNRLKKPDIEFYSEALQFLIENMIQDPKRDLTYVFKAMHTAEGVDSQLLELIQKVIEKSHVDQARFLKGENTNLLLINDLHQKTRDKGLISVAKFLDQFNK